jgi:hypothetical protein
MEAIYESRPVKARGTQAPTPERRAETNVPDYSHFLDNSSSLDNNFGMTSRQ